MNLSRALDAVRGAATEAADEALVMGLRLSEGIDVGVAGRYHVFPS